MSIPSIILYLGPEEGEKAEARNEVYHAMYKKYGDTLEKHHFYAFETSLQEIIALLQNGSLFGNAIFIRYSFVEQLKKKNDMALLLTYAENPVEHTVLIMESSNASVSKNIEKSSCEKAHILGNV